MSIRRRESPGSGGSAGLAELPPEQEGLDWYVVDRDFTWTYAHTHEDTCGPYFCRKR